MATGSRNSNTYGILGGSATCKGRCPIAKGVAQFKWSPELSTTDFQSEVGEVFGEIALTAEPMKSLEKTDKTPK